LVLFSAHFRRWLASCKRDHECGARRHAVDRVVADEDVMSLLLILIILLVLLGGGGMYLGGPRAGISLGGLILIIIIVMAVMGRL
jgi:hypothetical protein